MLWSNGLQVINKHGPNTTKAPDVIHSCLCDGTVTMLFSKDMGKSRHARDVDTIGMHIFALHLFQRTAKGFKIFTCPSIKIHGDINVTQPTDAISSGNVSLFQWGPRLIMFFSGLGQLNQLVLCRLTRSCYQRINVTPIKNIHAVLHGFISR